MAFSIIRGRARALLLMVTMVAAFAQVPGARADTIVVSPGNVDGFQFQHANCGGGESTGSAQFGSGPATAPLGAGSVHFTIGSDGNSFETVRQSGFHLTGLADLTALSYATYSQTAGGQAPYLLLNVDTDGDESLNDQLFFEPVYQTGTYGGDPVPDQGAVTTGAWQTWDALAGGWWSLNANTFGPPLTTLASYVAANPGARIVNTASGAGGLRIATGCGAGAWDGFVGATDALTVATAAATSTFDLDPSPAAPTVAIDAGDYISALEVSAVSLSGTYSAGSAVTAAIANNAECDGSAGGTTPVEATLDESAGTWTAGPFDLSDTATFPEGSTVCAYAQATLPNDEQSAVGVSAPAVIDTIAPGPGTIAFDDADGFINAAEAASGVVVSWTGGTDATDAVLGFAGADPAPPGCTPAPAAVSGSTTLNDPCLASLSQGTIVASIHWHDVAGNITEGSATIVKDTVAAVDVTSPSNGSSVATLVELSGTADPGSAIVVKEGSTTLATASADDGTWRAETTRAVGPHSFSVLATDPAGNTASDSVGVIVDATVPVIVAPAEGALVRGVAEVRGTSSGFGRIEIWEGSVRLLTIETDASGNWRTPVGFSEGPHTIVARWLNEIGTPTAFSAPRSVVADGSGPSVSITTAKDSIFQPNTPAAIAGAAADNRTVTRVELRYLNALGGPVLTANATCTGCGTPSATWTHTPSLLQGIYTVQARAFDATGQVSSPKAIRFVRL